MVLLRRLVVVVIRDGWPCAKKSNIPFSVVNLNAEVKVENFALELQRSHVGLV